LAGQGQRPVGGLEGFGWRVTWPCLRQRSHVRIVWGALEEHVPGLWRAEIAARAIYPPKP